MILKGENNGIEVLAELIPFLTIRKHDKLVSLLKEVKRQPMAIDWDEIILMKTIALVME